MNLLMNAAKHRPAQPQNPTNPPEPPPKPAEGVVDGVNRPPRRAKTGEPPRVGEGIAVPSAQPRPAPYTPPGGRCESVSKNCPFEQAQPRRFLSKPTSTPHRPPST